MQAELLSIKDMASTLSEELQHQDEIIGKLLFHPFLKAKLIMTNLFKSIATAYYAHAHTTLST